MDGEGAKLLTTLIIYEKALPTYGAIWWLIYKAPLGSATVRSIVELYFYRDKFITISQ